MRLLLGSVALVAFTAACGSEATTAPSSCTESRDFVVAMSDYVSSGVASLRVSDGSHQSRFGVDLGADPWLTRSSGRLFLIARDEDLVFELDPACGAPKARFSVRDEGAKAAQNPQDLAVDSAGSMWIPRFTDGSLLVVEGERRHVVSLADFDEDKNPNPSSVRIVATPEGERAFVVLERLDRDLLSRRPSSLLEIDTKTRAIVKAHPLAGRNPFGAMTEHEGALYLAEPGNFDDDRETLAGIERFDPKTRTSELLVRETELGGSITELTIAGSCAAAIVADPTIDVNATSLVTIDLRTRTVVQPLARSPLRTSGYELQGLAVHEGMLLVGDRRKTSAGTYDVHTFDIRADCTIAPRAERLALPQKPVAIRPSSQLSR